MSPEDEREIADHSKTPRRPVPFRGWEELGTLPSLLSRCSAYLFNMSNHLLYVLGHHRHPSGKPFDADPVRLCQTPARKGAVETRFEAVFGRSEANVPARLGPLLFVGACRLAWRSGQISDSETDLLRAAESPSLSREGVAYCHQFQALNGVGRQRGCYGCEAGEAECWGHYCATVLGPKHGIRAHWNPRMWVRQRRVHNDRSQQTLAGGI